MNRATAIGAACAGLLAGAAVWASVSGTIPNPFGPQPPSIDLVESGSSKARELGERFEAQPKPPAPGGGIPGIADPFQIPDLLADKPAWADDDVPGWQNPFDIPDDLAKLADSSDEEWRRRKRAREAAFAAQSRFPPNPEDDLGRFQFDWMIRHTVDTADLVADFSYFVNSADGSWLVAGDDIQRLMPGTLPRDATMDFLIRKANGDLLACGTQVQVGKACIKLGDELPAAFAWLGNAAATQTFLASIAATPQRLGEPPPGRAIGARGKLDIDGTDRYLQVWVAPGASTVATQVPWLGMGSGVIKDFRARANREVRRVRYEGIDRDGGDVVIDLKSIQATRAGRDTRDYRIITAFSTASLTEAAAMGARLQGDTARRVAALERSLRDCPPGDGGKPCRRLYRERIKATNQASRDEALDWARRHGLPVE